MSALEYVLGALVIIFSVIIIAVVLLQEGRESNMNAISGGSDSFMDKGHGRTLDAFLSRWTKILAIVFFVLVLAAMLVPYFVK